MKTIENDLFLERIKELKLKDSTNLLDYIQKEMPVAATIVEVVESEFYFDVYVNYSTMVQIYSYLKTVKSVEINQVFSNQAEIIGKIFSRIKQ